jgi:hypothetical protein
MSHQEIEELVNEFHDYWQQYGNDKARGTDREKSMLKDFSAWLTGKGFIDLKKLKGREVNADND